MAFIWNRILQIPIVVFSVLVLNFLILNFAPGDPAIALAGPDATPGLVEALRQDMGLNQPLPIRFWIYISNVAQGNLGQSYSFRRPVFDVILEHLPATFLLLGTALVLAIVLGVFLGVMAAKKPGSVTDGLTMVGALGVYSVPEFWVGMVFILIFGVALPWFPTMGMKTPGVTGLQALGDILSHLILPVCTLGLARVGLYARLTRSTMLEVLRQDFILTAWSKGCSEREVLYGHALRNALLPVVTFIGLQIRLLFIGAVMTETVFAWPGAGRLVFTAILERDYNLLLGSFLIISLLTIFANLLVDIAYIFLDPRVKYT